MKNIFLFIGLLCGFFTQAQESMNDKSAKKDVVAMSLNQKFTAPVLNAYQENSKSKIEDLFSYFQMLTDATLSDDLKKEVIKNIKLLFVNPNTIVLDFTSESFDRITLEKFIQKLLISEPILFSVSDETKYSSVDYNSWKTDYSITRTKSGIISKTKVVQKVFFYETQKVFGQETKNVFTTALGEM